MAKTGYGNFTLTYQTMWRGKAHNWSLASSHSGSFLPAHADQVTLLQAIHNQVIAPFFASGMTSQFLVAWKYYDGVHSAALSDVVYANAAASAAAGWNDSSDYGTAYAGGISYVSGLETCVVLEAPIGLSSSGRPLALRKFIHGVPGGSAGTDAPPYSTTTASPAPKLGDGSLPFSRVLIGPKGQQGTWQASPYYGAHKLSRRKKQTASKSSLISTVEQAALKAALGAAVSGLS